METEPQIVFEHMDASEDVRQRIMLELEHLEQFYGRITSARVSLSPPRQVGNTGSFYRTTIHLLLPGGREVAVSQSPSVARAEQDIFISIKDAFKAARRQLQDEVDRMEGQVKRHAGGPEQTGRVARLFTHDGYGFIVTPAGHEVFFSQRKVKHDGFKELHIDTPVYFEEELGDEGPVATAVRIAHEASNRD